MEAGEVYRNEDGEDWHIALDPTMNTPAYMVVRTGLFDLVACRIGSGGLYEAIGEHKLYRKANGRLVPPEPKPGELWSEADCEPLFITGGGMAICTVGLEYQLSELKLVKKLWPCDDN